MSAIEFVHGDLSAEVIGAFYEVFRDLRAGYLEQSYQRAMVIALEDRGIPSRSEVPTALYFRGRLIGQFRMDLVVADCILVECKTAERILPPHRAQVRNYLRASGLSLGIVLNFGATPTFKRIVNESSGPR